MSPQVNVTSDSELLELAAKAAGYPLGVCGNYLFIAGSMTQEFKAPGPWNPLADDGDALRLAIAVSMKMTEGLSLLLPDKFDPWAVVKDWGVKVREKSDGDGDPYAATRRAIVRAAAALAEGA